MTRQSTATNQEVQSLISRLDETVRHIDAEDLSGLAQMHGWCESLMELARKSSTISSEVGGTVAKVAQDLEALILGEVADATESFSALSRAVQDMVAAAAGAGDSMTATQPVANEAAEDTDWEASPVREIEGLSTQQVAESLSRVFDDLPDLEPEPICADSTAAPAADTDPIPDSPLLEPPTAPAPAAQRSPESDEAGMKAYVAEPLIIDIKEMDFVKGFVEEAREHIESIETAVLEVERCPGDTAKIDDLFRPFHTIKGMAGFLNLRDINCLTHEAETLLDQGRKGKRSVTPGVIDLVLGVVDVLKVQIASIGQWVAEPGSEPVPQPPVSEIIERLRGVVSGRLDADQLSAAMSGAARTTPNSAGRNESVAATIETTRTSQPAATAAESAAPAGSAAATTPSAPATLKGGDRSIRIDTEKLDALIDMVGELVIAQTLVNMSGDVAGNPKLSKDVTQVTKIVRDVQELAMAMRMVPIGPTFQKMARLIRDVSRKAGKQVNLTISGEDTELDKTVIQEIGDPLVHMVRNAVDHGVESPEARRAAGKPETGQVHLHAGHEGGNIVISIRDDGKGLDPAVLVAKAIEKGVIEPGTELTDQQAFALVFAPGFSTAAQVTDISGRGVGMDVVKRNIEQLRGKVEITSEKGQGTTFTIRLPLTLAIIDGMVIRTGGERFILPTITIQQSLRPLPEAITTVQHRGELLNVRGELIPLIQLGELFGLTGRVDPCQSMVIIAHCDGRLMGLVVEELIGQQQVVIKTLGERFEGLQGVSGAAILGDGRVGLILEMSGLNAANDRFSRSSRPARTAPGTRGNTVTQAAGNDTTEPQFNPAAEHASTQENNQ